ncbi:MAG: helix-turn-helix transcriptional regulator [Actinobacteria bacterium]|nr:helix-turn-helix transcriptional regulator [Actinomycetota bacterium]
MDESAPFDLDAMVAVAHEARAAHRFGEAHDAFMRVRQHGELSTDDVLAWSDAAWWLGHADRALELAELGHQRLLEEGQPIRAAMEAMSLGFLLMLRGELSAGSGWLRRGRSLVERSSDDHAMGYVLHLDAEEALESGDLDRAVDLARRAGEAGRRGSDTALTSLALMTEGRARLRAGAVGEAMALVDEAMLPVQAGQIAPEYAGNLYCQMIEICWQLADLRRAREWTAATERWCEQFDSSVMFSGICRMHRVQLRQLAGEWDAAEAEAEVVCRELVGMNTAVVAEGHYLLGDLLRLRGAGEEAEAAYRRAHELGRDPQPGLALLRAQSEQPAVAMTSLHTALAGHQGGDYRRTPLLRAVVEVAVEAGDLQAAGEAADELAVMADRWRTDGLRAAAAHGRGAVELAAGEAAAAIAPLRDAIRWWHELDAPYDGAKARMLLAEACVVLGDQDAGRLELDAAAATLERLGAVVDLQRLAQRRPDAQPPGGLTPREAEILALVAEGITNRQVADRLVISEKTVARHLANIYLKLDVATRTAAAAWARRQGIARSA